MYLTKIQEETFYEVHKERPFFESLIKFMTSGAVQVQVLEGEDAIANYTYFDIGRDFKSN